MSALTGRKEVVRHRGADEGADSREVDRVEFGGRVFGSDAHRCQFRAVNRKGGRCCCDLSEKFAISGSGALTCVEETNLIGSRPRTWLPAPRT